MPEQIQLPVLLSLLPKVGKMIQAEQDRPPMQQALTAQLMQDALKKEREKVAELKKTGENMQVRPDDEHDQGRGGGRNRNQRRPSEEAEEEPAESPDPWSGQIVNLRI